MALLVDRPVNYFKDKNIAKVSSKSLKILSSCDDKYCVITESVKQLKIPQTIKEAFLNNKQIYTIEPIIVQVADVKNENGRIYPRNELEKAVKEAQPRVKRWQMLGELDHGDATDEDPYPKLSKASHIVNQLFMNKDKVYAGFIILPTPYGEILKDLLEFGITLGVSMRGLGEVDNNGRVKDLIIITYEFVSFPSYGENVLADKSKLKLQKLQESMQKLKELKADSILEDYPSKRYLKIKIELF